MCQRCVEDLSDTGMYSWRNEMADEKDTDEFCKDEKHDIPCQLPCLACELECL